MCLREVAMMINGLREKNNGRKNKVQWEKRRVLALILNLFIHLFYTSSRQRETEINKQKLKKGKERSRK